MLLSCATYDTINDVILLYDVYFVLVLCACFMCNCEFNFTEIVWFLQLLYVPAVIRCGQLATQHIVLLILFGCSRYQILCTWYLVLYPSGA